MPAPTPDPLAGVPSEPSGADAAADPRLRPEQIGLLYRGGELSILASAGIAVLLAAVMWGRVPSVPLLGWLSLMVLVSANRWLLVRRYRRDPPAPQACERWARVFMFGTAVNGIGWGLASLVLFVPGSLAYQAVLLVALTGVVAGGVSTLAAVRGCAYLFLFPVAIPALARFAFEGTGAHLGLAAMTGFYTVYMARFAGILNAILAESLRLRFRNLDLVEGLREASERSEALNAELAAARDRAVESARAKSEFLASMSHEIRTPINGVVGLTELLATTELDAEQRGLVRNIQTSSETLLAVINDVLDFSKIEQGHLELERIDFDPGELAEDVATSLAQPAHARGLELVCAVDPRAPRSISGDPARLRQVLNNLVGNAVKFTEAGEVRVEVAVEEGGDGGDGCTLRWRVVDTGIGIAPEQRGRIFGAFAQADRSISRRFGGTGLGLAICQRLLAGMGAELELDSEPGRGSCFSFALPCESAPREPAGGDLAGLRVLVHDPAASAGAAMARHLDALGATADVCTSLAEARAMLEAARARGVPYDAGVLSARDVEGGEIGAGDLRALAAVDPPPRLVLTVRSPRERARLGAGAAPVQAWLAKPVRRADLVRAVRGAVRGTALSEPVCVPAEPGSARGPALGLRVLVVEDNPVNREVAVRMLRVLGCEAETAEHGAAALERLAEPGIDLVVMDCHMPVLDGLEATRRLRRREARAGGGERMPVIALTASAVEGDRERCLDAGMDDYLAKPFTLAALRAKLAAWSRRAEPVAG